MTQFPPQTISDVQLQGQPPQSDIQSHQQHHLHHQLHPHAQSANPNLNLNQMLNNGSSMSAQSLAALQDPNLDPKLSGLNEQPKLNFAGLVPPHVDPKGQLDLRNLNPKDLLQLLKQLPMLKDPASTARRRTNSTSSQPTAGPSSLPNTQSQGPPPAPAETPPSTASRHSLHRVILPGKGVKRKRGRVGDDGEEMDAEDWTRQRKDNHKEVERRRRGNINHGINELAKVVPFAGADRAKSAILHRAVTYIHHLKENEARNIEKWTLEKLLMDQAMADLQSQLEEVQRLWGEERQAKERALLELDVIRSSGVRVNMPTGMNVQQNLSSANGPHLSEGPSASSSDLPTTYGSQRMYHSSSEQQHQQAAKQDSVDEELPDTEHGGLAEQDLVDISKELTAVHDEADDDGEDEDAEHNGEDDEEDDDGDDDGEKE